MNNPYLQKFKEQQLRACQLKQLSILEDIDRICKKHQIGYWLDGGTLLGAVRHGGFIPWDDDADISMLRSEYTRFREACEKDLDHSRGGIRRLIWCRADKGFASGGA